MKAFPPPSAPLKVIVTAEPPRFGGSDIEGLMAAGVPFVDFDQDASRYFDLHHSADDTLDKIDPDDWPQNVAGLGRLPLHGRRQRHRFPQGARGGQVTKLLRSLQATTSPSCWAGSRPSARSAWSPAASAPTPWSGWAPRSAASTPAATSPRCWPS